ncbi:MAG: endonuclease NucS [candidate division KSB1 bacterium]|nr:endonuclease NucS [candidate division KSB1 bacterium]
MRLFTLDANGKMVPYQEMKFKFENRESDLEDLLENNPEYFFENTKILIIGRQITTNLDSSLDLLGIDKAGNTVVIELKRDKTPRDTIAQLLEYASFVENLDYSQLNEIYQNYSGEEISLEDYHQQYFQSELDEKVSFNKYSKLVIVAHEITREIKQTAQYLRKKGLDIYCLEFKYFSTQSGEKIISCDVVVGEEEFLRQKIESKSLPKIDEKQFRKSLDKFGTRVFDRIFQFARQNQLLFRWGSKGFSLNLEMEGGFVGLFFGYPPDSVFKQSIYTGFEEIAKKVNNSEEIISDYRTKLEQLGYFVPAKSNLKWIIDTEYSDQHIIDFLQVIDDLMSKIKANGLKANI